MKCNKELKILKLFKFHFNKFTIFIANLILTIIPKKIFSNKEVIVKKYKIKGRSNKYIKVYEFMSKNKTNDNMIYMHGGGFYLKGAPYHYALCREYVKRCNINVYFVDYSLSTKYKYPNAVNDCLSVYEWLIKNKNISKYNIGLGGDSVGSNLVLSLDILLKEKGILPKYNMLIYPVIDNIKTKSKELYQNTPMWNSKLNQEMWKKYIKDIKYDSIFNHIININTYIETCEIDPLHDEGIIYYNYLKQHNINCILNETKETFHGYDFLYKTNITKENLNKRFNFINNFKQYS